MPQNIPLLDRANQDALSLFGRLSSSTVASSFQLQSRDQFGGQIYNRSNTALENLSTQFGYAANASGNRATALGAFAYGREDDSVAVGVYALGLGTRSIAIGPQAQANYADSIAIGSLARTTKVGQVVLGSRTQSISEIYLGRGVNHTGAATTVAVRVADGVGTNVAGDDLVLLPGRSTGNGAGGNFIIYRTSTGSSGSGQNAATPIIRIEDDGGIFYSGTGTFPTFTQSFLDAGLVRLGPSALAANSGILCNNSDAGNGNIGEFAVLAAVPALAIASARQGTAVNIPIIFYAEATGTTTAINGQMAIANGVWIGDESTISMLGQGTLNVSVGVHLNGTAYTNPDYVFEHYFKGRVKEFADRPGAMAYKRRSLEEIEEYAALNLHLPQLVDMGLRNPKGDDIFARADGALLLHEEVFLTLFDFNRRLKALEARNEPCR